jgi:hypothetical protein
MSRYTQTAFYSTGMSLSKSDFENMKKGLERSCKFTIDINTDNRLVYDKLNFECRYYRNGNDDDIYHYHVTNTERKKILKLIRDHY